METTSKKSNRKNKKTQLFLLFLLASLFLWFLSKLDKEYNHQALFKISYENMDNSKVFKNKPNNTIFLNLKASGYQFLAYKLNKPKIKLNLKYLQKLNESSYYFLPNSNLNIFKEQVSKEIEINYIKPDTLYFDFDLLNSKKVKIIPNIHFDLKLGYQLADSLTLKPKQITISGPKSILDSIKNVYTQELTLKDVDASFSKKINLELVSNKNIKYSDKSVQISGTIKKFTQGKIEVPIQLIGLPEDVKIHLLKNRISLIYKVSLEDFNSIKDAHFEVICDYEKTIKEGLTYLVPIINKKPNFIKDIKLETNKIDFFIER